MDSIEQQDQPEVSNETRNWAIAAHLSALVNFVGVPSVLGPVVVWIMKKDDPYVVAAAKEAVNFNISFFIYAIVAGLSLFILIGLLLLPVVLITWLVLVIIAGVRTADGQQYRYPVTLRLIS